MPGGTVSRAGESGPTTLGRRFARHRCRCYRPVHRLLAPRHYSATRTPDGGGLLFMLALPLGGSFEP